MPRVTDTHDCPAGCGLQVPRSQFACRSDWYRLPAGMREAITTNYRVDFGAHMEAMIEAQTWYLDNLPGR